MNRKFVFSFLMLMAVLGMDANAQQKRVHTIGDSTMDGTYDVTSTDKRGWCMMLQSFLDKEQITVNNRGKAGASTKSFYKEAGYWPTLVTGGSNAMSAGDYLVIQFAHNDGKHNGVDGDELKEYYESIGRTADAYTVDYCSTSPFNTYKVYLRKFIEEAKAMGVKPIVVGAISRKYFTSDGKDITRSGRHDLGDSFDVIKDGQLLKNQKVPETDDTYDYTASAKAVAAEYDDVPFIDLTDLTAKLYVSYGEAYCTKYMFCSADKTHPAAMGAALIARTFAQAVKDQYESEQDEKKKAVLKGLADCVVLNNDIIFSPSSGELGEAYLGMSVMKEFNLSAFGMTPADGEMTVSVTDGFELSTDKENWSNQMTVKYSGGNLVTSVYVRISIEKVGVTTGTITASDGTNTKSIDLSVNGKDLTGGLEASCAWPLHTLDVNAVSETLTGSDVVLAGMTQYSNLAMPETGDTYDSMVLFNIDGGTWPAGEMDEVSTRYVEFKITVPRVCVFNLDKISFNVAGWGGNTLCFKAYYATKPDFSDQVNLVERKNMVKKESVAFSINAVKEVAGGESLYLRFYPWLNTGKDATGKYMALSDVTIHGYLNTGSTAIVNIDADKARNAKVRYTLTGQRIASNGYRGIVIENGKKVLWK